MLFPGSAIQPLHAESPFGRHLSSNACQREAVMGSMKTFLSAAAVLTVLSVPAFAADMAPLAPPPMLGAAPPAVSAELGTGWYLRGDVGYGEFRNLNDTPFGVAVPP